MFKKIKDSLVNNNPVFSLFLGLCSALAISSSLDNALGMGVGVIVVLFMSNTVISLIRKITPDEIRIPVYIVIIAALTKSLDLMMAAYTPMLHSSLGTFIQLIAVNCIILGRAESFASKNGVFASMKDALTIGLGFTVSLVLISVTREFLSTGGLILSNPFTGLQVVQLGLPEALASDLSITLFRAPAGAFFTFALFAALFAFIGDDKRKQKGVSK
ncbi:MAG: electron transport complex subunit RsxE [Erysipelothrix sp.]|nr:electron transport complex subunit RsxE [Erysipelothrix sp.]